MKKNWHLIVILLAIILQSCTPVISNSAMTNNTINIVEDTNKDSIIHYSPNQIIVKFGNSWTPQQKDSLRVEFHVNDSIKCPCDDDSLELWTINTDSLSIEGATRNLNDRSDGGEDVEGDRQFEISVTSAGSFTPTIDGSNIQVDINNSDKVNIAIVDTGINYDYFFNNPFPSLLNALIGSILN